MSKRRSDCSSSNEKKKVFKSSRNTRNRCLEAFEAEYGSIRKFGQDAWSELSQKVVSNVSKSVVSLASFNGNHLHFACTGIVVDSNKSVTRILTSASLVRPFDDDNKIIPTLMIQVCLPNKKIVIGSLMHYDLRYNVAVVEINPFPDFRAARFDPHMQFGSDTKVVAVGRWFNSGRFMATSGIVIDEPSGVYPEHLMMSTCKIPLVMTGGPLIDLAGNFVGMNFNSEDKESSPLLPRNKIYDCLVNSGTLRSEIKHGGDKPKLTLKSTFAIEKPSMPFILNVGDGSGGESENKNQKLSMSSTSDSKEIVDEEPWPEAVFCPLPDDEFTELVRNDLRSHGYPMPIKFEGGMRLINTFEEEFAEDTWSKLSKKVASNISRSVVSLASFKGEERFFACTGIFIDFDESTSRVLTSASLVRTSDDENKTADSLKIQVYLPNKQLAVGTLLHCNFSYNIAVVSIANFRCLRAAEFHNAVQIKPQMEVVAIGRGFESGKLMATSGIVVDKESKLDCGELMITTCKITKAAIGGPLVDFDGNFVGMNFYGREETPYLPKK
uniref:Uncharacterized protein n=1 Tax=Arundo donax TaxID=35708 RepID=A0A0A9CVD2_ARUDO